MNSLHETTRQQKEKGRLHELIERNEVLDNFLLCARFCYNDH